MVRLPVSGTVVDMRPVTGAEDMLLLEAGGSQVEISIALANRLARRCDGSEMDAASLPLADLEALLLQFRRTLLGDRVLSHAKCPGAGCGTETDISFRISDYLAHYRPRRPRAVDAIKDEPGWFALSGSAVKFRLVTAADILASRSCPHAESELARRTICPGTASRHDRKRVQQAMETLAPPLAQEVAGRCPACGTTTQFSFDPQGFVQRELQYEAAFLYEDVNLLAGRYHWSEEKILSLPRMRRLQYAELAMRGGVAN